MSDFNTSISNYISCVVRVHYIHDLLSQQPIQWLGRTTCNVDSSAVPQIMNWSQALCHLLTHILQCPRCLLWTVSLQLYEYAKTLEHITSSTDKCHCDYEPLKACHDQLRTLIAVSPVLHTMITLGHPPQAKEILSVVYYSLSDCLRYIRGWS